MDIYDSRQVVSSGCPPASSEDSLFFNLILGTSYEDTKENCLLFLKNYSKNNMYYPKREIFKLLINELILNETSNKMGEGNESVYLMRQVIRKYSKNNILNALYDYISEKDNDFFPPILDNNPSNTSADSSLNRLQNSQSERDSKSIINSNSSISQEIKKKEKLENGEYSQRNKNYLSRKRQLTKNNKKTEKKKNGKANKKLIKKVKEKKENAQKEQEKADASKINEEVQKEKIADNKEEIKIKKEQIQNREKKDGKAQNMSNKKEKGKSKETKKEEGKKEEINKYKMKLRKLSPNKSKASDDILLKSDKIETKDNKNRGFSSGEKIVKKEFKLYNSMQTSSIENIDNINPNYPKEKETDKCQMNIMLYLDEQNPKNKEKTQEENNYSAHLIKSDYIVYSYNKKRTGGIKNNTIYFECNNRKCRGRGEYDIENKIFNETFKHSLVPTSHNICFLYYSLRDKLLNDNEAIGYQILRDNSIIKDDKVVFLN